MNRIMKNKAFIFQYDPYFSPKRMFGEFKEAMEGKKHIQPKNVMVANDLSVIHSILSKSRLKTFYCIKEKKPTNIHELASFLRRDYTNVWRDCHVLANCGIIELKEVKGNDKELQPVVLYERIVLDFPVREKVAKGGIEKVSANN
jgi:predicted transcriptional regulator